MSFWVCPQNSVQRSSVAEVGGFIAQKVAEAKAQKIIDHREAKMDSLADFQKEKIRENRFFRESDLEYGTDGNRFN